MIKILDKKNILITGCNRGIGKSTVKVCASMGANIWANARSYNKDFEKFCKSTSQEFNVKIYPVYFDLINHDEIKDAVKLIRSSDIPINGLINNAGITFNSFFQMTSMINIKENLDVNFVGPFFLTQYIIKMMIRNGGGSIVSVSSSAAMDANPGRSAYGASKAALLTATKALSREVGEHNLRANIIAPGVTQTEMIESMSSEIIEETVNTTSLKRCGNPEEIAYVAAFLISDMSSYITGQTIRVDGGM